MGNIYYKGYTIAFDVYGDISICVYPANGDEPVNLRHKGGSKPFFDDVDCRAVIADDDALKRLIEDNNIVFENNNWINIVVINDRNQAYVSEVEAVGESNILEAVEANFDHYIKYVDDLIARENRRFAVLYCQEREMSIKGVFKTFDEAKNTMLDDVKKYLTEECGVSETDWQEGLEKYDEYPWDNWGIGETFAWTNCRSMNIDWQIKEIEI